MGNRHYNTTNSEGRKTRRPEEESNDTTSTTTDKRKNYRRNSKNPSNDPNWYVYSEQAARDNATLNFGTQAGAPFSYSVPTSVTNGSFSLGYDLSSTQVENQSFPGIMALYTQPVIGRYGSREAPINQAAFQLFTQTRLRQKIPYTYDAPDLMQYALAITSLYALYAHLNRIYGIVNLYVRENNYTPRALSHVLGVDLDDLVRNLADFRAWLNNQAYNVSKFALPTGIPLIQRSVVIMSNVYTDSDSVKGQMYVHVPMYFWSYNEPNGTLDPVYWTEFNTDGSDYKELKSFIDIQDMWNSIIEPLFNNQTFQVMSSNIALAYGPDLVSIPSIDERYTLVPVLDPMMLLQIQNSRAIGFNADPTVKLNRDLNTLEMVSDKYTLPNNCYSGPGLTWSQIFNTSATATSPMHVMEAMPNFVIAKSEMLIPQFDGAGTYPTSVNNSNRAYATVTGPEVIACYKIWFNDNVNGKFQLTATANFGSSIASVSGDQDTTRNKAVNSIITRLSNFDWHPIIRFSDMSLVRQAGGGDAPGLSINQTGLINDIDNYTMVSEQMSRQIHDVMMISLFRIPESHQ